MNRRKFLEAGALGSGMLLLGDSEYFGSDSAEAQVGGPRFSTATPTVINVLQKTIYVSLPLTNSGGADASNLNVTRIALGTVQAISPGSFPALIGNVLVKQSRTIEISFDGTGLTVGTRFLLTVRGSYIFGGNTFGFTINRYIIIPEAGPELIVYSNRFEGLLLSTKEISGEYIEFFGKRDDQGFPTAINNIFSRSPDGALTKLYFDDGGGLTRMEAPNGVIFEIAPISDTLTAITVIPPGNAVRIPVVIDRTTLTANSQANACICSMFPPSPELLVDQIAAAPNLTTGVAVTVRNCGMPALNATVLVTYSTILEQREIPAEHQGGGVYIARVPLPDLEAGSKVANELGESSVSKIVSLCAPLSKTMTGFSASQIIQAGLLLCVQLSVAVAPFVTPAVAAAIAAACSLTVTSVVIICATYGNAGRVITTIKKIIDTYTTLDIALEATATIGRTIIKSPNVYKGKPDGFDNFEFQIEFEPGQAQPSSFCLDGTYFGSYVGTETNEDPANYEDPNYAACSDLETEPVSGIVVFSVSDGQIVVTQPGNGSGGVSSFGTNLSFQTSGSGGSSDTTCSWSGSFTLEGSGSVSGRGVWSCIFDDPCPGEGSSGGWEARRFSRSS